jgi:hypothetical protein
MTNVGDYVLPKNTFLNINAHKNVLTQIWNPPDFKDWTGVAQVPEAEVPAEAEACPGQAAPLLSFREVLSRAAPLLRKFGLLYINCSGNLAY